MSCISIWKKRLLLAGRFIITSQNVRTKTMQAWQAFEYGGPEKLLLNTSAQIPVIKNCSDVLIKIHGSSINPLDYQMLEGYGATTFNFMRQLSSCSLNLQAFPLILGRDFSGTVAHVGKKVKNLKVGDEVWGALSPWQNGSFAEYVVAPACYISKKPNALSHVEASSLPYAALTAWSALSTFGGLTERTTYRKKVLIIGASGGVGTFAVQLLRAWGADVTAICSSDAAEMILNLGAENVIDYQSPDFRSNLKEMKGFDLIFDNIGKEYPELCIDLLKTWKNSKYVTVVSPLLKNNDDRGLLFGIFMSGIQASLDTAMSFKDGKSFRWAYFMPNGCALKTIAKMVENKQVNPIVEKVFRFNEVPEAFEKAIAGHARGKIVIDFIFEEANLENKQKSKNNMDNLRQNM